MITVNDSAQIALGKFYLHRWEGQVLVDWATSVLEQEVDSVEIRRLAKMEGAERTAQLDQFIHACSDAGIVVYENMELSIRAYCVDLRRRTLAGEIALAAAFAQLRPLAYDNTSVLIPGLSELDEDFNLLDSSQPAFHHPEMTKENSDDYLRLFFENLSVRIGRPAEPTGASRGNYASPVLPEFANYAEAVAVIFLVLVVVFFLLMLLSSQMVPVSF